MLATSLTDSARARDSCWMFEYRSSSSGSKSARCCCSSVWCLLRICASVSISSLRSCSRSRVTVRSSSARLNSIEVICCSMRARKMLTSPALFSRLSSRSASTRASSPRSVGATGSRPGRTVGVSRRSDLERGGHLRRRRHHEALGWQRRQVDPRFGLGPGRDHRLVRRQPELRRDHRFCGWQVGLRRDHDGCRRRLGRQWLRLRRPGEDRREVFLGGRSGEFIRMLDRRFLGGCAGARSAVSAGGGVSSTISSTACSIAVNGSSTTASAVSVARISASVNSAGAAVGRRRGRRLGGKSRCRHRGKRPDAQDQVARRRQALARVGHFAHAVQFVERALQHVEGRSIARRRARFDRGEERFDFVAQVTHGADARHAGAALERVQQSLELGDLRASARSARQRTNAASACSSSSVASSPKIAAMSASKSSPSPASSSSGNCGLYDAAGGSSGGAIGVMSSRSVERLVRSRVVDIGFQRTHRFVREARAAWAR